MLNSPEGTSAQRQSPPVPDPTGDEVVEHPGNSEKGTVQGHLREVTGLRSVARRSQTRVRRKTHIAGINPKQTDTAQDERENGGRQTDVWALPILATVPACFIVESTQAGCLHPHCPLHQPTGPHPEAVSLLDRWYPAKRISAAPRLFDR